MVPKRFSTAHWPKEWELGLIKTKNAMGVMTTELSPVGIEFAELAKTAKKPILDVGAAYGISTYPALQNGAEVIACDIDQYHLQILRAGVPEDFHKKLTTIVARFPDEIDFQKDSLSAIHISMVLHFLDGDTVERGLIKCYEWLESAGKLFIVVMTPYHGLFSDLMPVYNMQVNRGEKWPGVIELKQYVNDTWDRQLPKFGHFFMPNIMQQALEQAKFSVEKIEYFSFKNIPEQYKADDKAFIAVVATKN